MPRFDPLNERLKKQYEEVLLNIKHREKRTVVAAWNAITLFETFTGRQPFTTFSPEQAKGFREWLAKQTNEQGQPLSLGTMRATLGNVRDFIMWLHTYSKVARKINGQAIGYLALSANEDRAARASKPRKAPTVEQFVRAVRGMPHGNDLEKRDRAVMAMAGITAMRDAALISLRHKDIDLEARSVWQDPKHVRTKFGKGILTVFVPFEAWLEEVVVEWVRYARDVLGMGPNDPVFPQTHVELNTETQEFEKNGLSKRPWANASPVRAIFKSAFERVGLPYFHPHTVRHMLSVWGMENLSQLEYKALSQNIGHEHAMTTYNAYGYIQPEKQSKLIRSLGQRSLALAGVTDDELFGELARRRK